MMSKKWKKITKDYMDGKLSVNQVRAKMGLASIRIVDTTTDSTMFASSNETSSSVPPAKPVRIDTSSEREFVQVDTSKNAKMNKKIPWWKTESDTDWPQVVIYLTVAILCGLIGFAICAHAGIRMKDDVKPIPYHRAKLLNVTTGTYSYQYNVDTSCHVGEMYALDYKGLISLQGAAAYGQKAIIIALYNQDRIVFPPEEKDDTKPKTKSDTAAIIHPFITQ